MMASRGERGSLPPSLVVGLGVGALYLLLGGFALHDLQRDGLRVTGLATLPVVTSGLLAHGLWRLAARHRGTSRAGLRVMALGFVAAVVAQVVREAAVMMLLLDPTPCQACALAGGSLAALVCVGAGAPLPGVQDLATQGVEIAVASVAGTAVLGVALARFAAGEGLPRLHAHACRHAVGVLLALVVVPIAAVALGRIDASLTTLGLVIACVAQLVLLARLCDAAAAAIARGVELPAARVLDA